MLAALLPNLSVASADTSASLPLSLFCHNTCSERCRDNALQCRSKGMQHALVRKACPSSGACDSKGVHSRICQRSCDILCIGQRHVHYYPPEFWNMPEVNGPADTVVGVSGRSASSITSCVVICSSCSRAFSCNITALNCCMAMEMAGKMVQTSDRGDDGEDGMVSLNESVQDTT